MLTLTRKVGQRIVIGENVILTVLSVEGGRAQLGVSAPREIPVLREEILQREPTASSGAVGALSGPRMIPSEPAPQPS